MQFTRPFRGADLHYFAKAADLGFDFVELLVPEPEDGLDLAETRRAAEDAGIFLVLAARVNPSRSIASEDAANRQGGLDYLKHCVEVADRIGARIIGGPLYGEPMVFAGRPPVPRTDEDIAARAERTISGLKEVAPLRAPPARFSPSRHSTASRPTSSPPRASRWKWWTRLGMPAWVSCSTRST